MRVLLAGSAGQLGRCFIENAGEVELIAPPEAEFDILDAVSIDALMRKTKPDCVINAAAFTDVDGCETQEMTAYEVNAVGPSLLANACRDHECSLVHISTNCVFDGESSRAYFEYDQPNPISAYGRTKLAGELAVAAVLNEHYIVRTAWLYSEHGRNFPKTVLRLAGERDSLTMVADEVSTPTYAPDLARAVFALIGRANYGIVHFTNEGQCSRYEFAREILSLAGKPDFPMAPTNLADYQRPSRPPLFSPIANIRAARLGIRLRSWQDALAEAMPLLQL